MSRVERKPTLSHQKETDVSGFIQKLEQIISKEMIAGEVFMISIAGASGAGKSTIANTLSAEISSCAVMGLDNYLQGWSIGLLNHDSGDPNKPYFAGLNPGVYDLERLHGDLIKLKQGESIEMPVFDEITKSPSETRHFVVTTILVFEGIYALESPFLELSNVPVLVEASLHDRLVRKIVRNSIRYKQKVNDIIHTYLTKDEPTYPYYRDELRSKARIIVNNSLNPKRDFGSYTGRREILCDGTVYELAPKQGRGELQPEEQLTVVVLRNNQNLLSYKVGQKLLVQDIIDDDVYALLRRYYDIKV